MPEAAPSRHLAACAAVVFIVYTPGEGAEARGYEPWLRQIDNPFFNAIPGVHHYANWKIVEVLSGAAPSWTHFDFQGLTAPEVLHDVWFNRDLDAFRSEWIRLWGYGAGAPPPVQRNAYLMQPDRPPIGAPQPLARLTGGRGAPPPAADLVWRVTDTLRKHFATGAAGAAWRVPAAEDNPLGLDWLALRYGAGPPAGEPDGGAAASLDVLVRCIAAPPDSS